MAKPNPLVRLNPNIDYTDSKYEDIPNIFEIEMTLKALSAHDPVGVWQCRKQLKWFVRRTEKKLHVGFPNPYYPQRIFNQ